MHIGIGKSHRVHQADCLDALLRKGRDKGLAILNAGITDSAEDMRAALAGEDQVTAAISQAAGDGQADRDRCGGGLLARCASPA